MMRRYHSVFAGSACILTVACSTAWAGLPEYQAAVGGEASLISYYTFDGDVGAAVTDVTANTNDGTLQGTAIFGPGVVGTDQSISLDGGGWANFGPVSDFAFPDGSGTVEAWVYPTFASGAGDRVIVASRNGGPTRYSLHVRTHRAGLNVWTIAAWNEALVPMEIDRWYHVAIVFEAGMLRFYVDGQLIREVGHPLGPDTNQPFEIGSSSEGGSEQFIGRIDEVAVYSDALSGSAIQAHVNALYTPAPGVSITPTSAGFRLPDDSGPKDFTLGLPAPAGLGGTAVQLDYNDSVVQVRDAADVLIPAGGAVTIPQGSSSAALKITGAAPGSTTLLATSPGLPQGLSVLTVTRASITLSPSSKTFVSPGDLGPLDVTIGLSGVVAGAGGIPVTLTYDANVVAVTTTGGTPIPSGGTVTVPQGAGQVGIKVSGVGPGTTTLNAASTGFTTGQGSFGAEFPKSAALIDYQAAVMSEASLIGYYTFDDDTTSVQDRKPSGTPINGTLIGTTAFSPRGEGGRVLQLAGAGHVNFGMIPDFEFPDGSGTVEMWIRPGAPPFGTNPALAAARDDAIGGSRYSMHLDNFRNSWGVWQGGSYEPQGFNMNPDKWYHVVAVFDAGTITIYTDGFLVGRTAQALGGAGRPFQIGSSSPAAGGQERYRGGIDEVAVYSDPLSPETVLAHYQTLAGRRYELPSAATAVLTNYQASVMGTPSLISYYTFDGDTTAVADSKDGHSGALQGITDWAEGFAGGQALGLHGSGLVALGDVEDFKFADDTGTVEAWVNTAALGAGNRSPFSGRDTLVRYTVHVGTSASNMGVTTGSPAPRAFVTGPVPGGLARDQWYHLAAVFNAGKSTLYVNGDPVFQDVVHALGDLGITNFQIGAGTNLGAFAFLGLIDEVAVYSEPLTAEQVAAHFGTTALNLSPTSHEFHLPTQAGPISATLSLPQGTVAPAGGTPITLTFDPAVINVDAGGGPIASGSQVVVPEGAGSVNLAVSAAGLGSTVLSASSPGVMFGDTAGFRVLLADQGIIIVDDHFDDNPASDPLLDLSALGINANGPGAGWDTYAQGGMTHRERGTSWEHLATGTGAWALGAISGKDEDEFKFMTPQGARLEWVINNVRITADDTFDKVQFPGGEFSDCRHELGVVSVNRPNAGGSNEMYANTQGGIYINLFYSAAGPLPTQDVVVTGAVRVVNSTHAGGDLESEPGLETAATFQLPGITRITPDSLLAVTLEVDELGWEIGFSANADPVFFPLTTGVHTVPGGKLGGGWDAASLNDAAISTEFNNGGFAYAHFQHLNAGRGSASLDRARVCIGCKLSTDCPDPFSDADGDNDTDQADFAVMQRCFSGVGGGTPDGCRCFDRNEDGDIEATDVAAFIECAALSGPEVPSDKACDD